MTYHINKSVEIVHDEFGDSYKFTYDDECNTVVFTDTESKKSIYIPQEAIQHVIDVLTELKHPLAEWSEDAQKYYRSPND